jgi:3-oxoacyl-(acyl-carrier-protein) synthase
MGVGEDAFARHQRGEPLDPDRYLWSQPCHRPTRAVVRALGATGPALTMSTACTSGATAIGVGLDLLRSGRARRVVAFGTDALCQLTTSGFAALGLHSAAGCRPFDVDRDGMCLGEGAAALLLELGTGDRPPLAEVLGFGTAVDAHHLSTPDPEARGAIAAMHAALTEAEIAASELGYVNAHGTGTVLNDAMEALALGRVVPGVPVSSTKGATGHTLGAAGALEAVFTVLALRDGALPPNVGVRSPVPGLDLVRHTRRAPLSRAMSVNFAFGGHNTALVFGRPA